MPLFETARLLIRLLFRLQIPSQPLAAVRLLGELLRPNWKRPE
jgi:hypothetical protein